MLLQVPLSNGVVAVSPLKTKLVASSTRNTFVRNAENIHEVVCILCEKPCYQSNSLGGVKFQLMISDSSSKTLMLEIFCWKARDIKTILSIDNCALSIHDSRAQLYEKAE